MSSGSRYGFVGYCSDKAERNCQVPYEAGLALHYHTTMRCETHRAIISEDVPEMLCVLAQIPVRQNAHSLAGFRILPYEYVRCADVAMKNLSFRPRHLVSYDNISNHPRLDT